MEITDPIFIHDMECAGREIVRCIGRAHDLSFGAEDFIRKMAAELTGLRDHMLSMNQSAESALVTAAIDFLYIPPKDE